MMSDQQVFQEVKKLDPKSHWLWAFEVVPLHKLVWHGEFLFSGTSQG